MASTTAPLCLDTTVLVTPPRADDKHYQALIPIMLARTNLRLELYLGTRNTSEETKTSPPVSSPSRIPATPAESNVDDGEPHTLLTTASWALRDPVISQIWASTFLPDLRNDEVGQFPPGYKPPPVSSTVSSTSCEILDEARPWNTLRDN